MRNTVHAINEDATLLVRKYKLIDRQLAIVHDPFLDSIRQALATATQVGRSTLSQAETIAHTANAVISKVKQQQTSSRSLIHNQPEANKASETSSGHESEQADGQIGMRRSRRLSRQRSSTAPQWDLGSDDEETELGSKRRQLDAQESEMLANESLPLTKDPPKTTRKLAIGSARRILTTAKKPLAAISRVYTSSKKTNEALASIKNLR